jgi:polyisoprenoid-binding protein YceI
MFNRFVSSILSSFILIALTVLASAAQASEYKIDPDHSKIAFSVKHLMISEVEGRFSDFAGSFKFDADKGALSAGDFIVQAKSIDTGVTKRDEHLRSPDFFDVAKYPTLSVKNTKVTKVSKDKFKWTGDLNMHGQTHPVTFDLEHKGNIKDPWGNNRAAFTALATINRKEWGLTWNKALEAGGVTVGDEVKLKLDVEAIEQKADAPKPAKK